MGIYKVEILSPAWVDLDLIADYHLREVGPISAQKITNKILDALEQLELFPLSCPFVPYKELAELGFRMLVCGKYVCVYKLQGNVIHVHHIVAASANYLTLFM